MKIEEVKNELLVNFIALGFMIGSLLAETNQDKKLHFDRIFDSENFICYPRIGMWHIILTFMSTILLFIGEIHYVILKALKKDYFVFQVLSYVF